MKLLFVCVGNSCRSQMAEAIANDLGYDAKSAGTKPGIAVSEDAVLVMNELGIETSNLFPKNVDNFDPTDFDMIISMGCGVECPTIPIDQDWRLDDPLGRDLNFFREIRDKIVHLISELPNQTDA